MQKYQDFVLDTKGRAVAGANVTVTTSAGATATIYSDNGSTSQANPMTTGTDGGFAFYAADGRYNLTISGTGFTARTVSDVLLEDQLSDIISVADFGGEPSVDCAAALIAAGASTTGPVVIPPGAWTCTATTSNSDDILALLDRIRCDGELTINLASGTHALTEQVVVNSPDAQRITILGAATVDTTATSQVSVSGSAKAYSVIIGVASSAGVVAGDYALVGVDGMTGTGDYHAHAGVWKVTAVDSGGANRLTLLNTHHGAAFPTNTLTNAQVVVLKSVLQFTACDGFRFEGGQPLGLLDRVAIVGDYNVAAGTGTTGCHGIITASPVLVNGADSNATFNTGGFVTIGASVGVSAFGEQGIAVSGRGMMVANFVASCSNRKRGWYAEGSHIRAKLSVGSGNGEDGYISDTTGFIQANISKACGNGLNGYWSTNHSLLVANQTAATGNLVNGYEARGMTRLSADTSTALNNTGYGYTASDGGMIDADSATATGNGAGGFDASYGSVIDCNSSTSTTNTGYGYRAQYDSVVKAGSATVSGNTTASYYSRNGSVLIESGGTVNANDVPTYVVAQRIYNATKANYFGFNVSSIGDLALTGDGTSRFVFKSGGVFHPSGDNTQDLGRTSERWKQAYIGRLSFGASATVFDGSGAGTPEGNVSAGIGSTYRRTDGGAGTTFYVKESGTGNTGWVAK